MIITVLGYYTGEYKDTKWVLYGFTSAEALRRNANELVYRDCLPELEEIHQVLFDEGYSKGELQQVTKADKAF